jgi:hypothetical protein
MTDDQRWYGLYERFNARDVDAVLAETAPDVDWPNAWEGGRVIGHDAVRDYWRRQFNEIDPALEVIAVTAPDADRVAVRVHQVVRTLHGAVVGDGHVTHVYELRDGLIARMDVQEDPAPA